MGQIGTVTLTKTKPSDTFRINRPNLGKKIHLRASSTPYSISVWNSTVGQGEKHSITKTGCDLEGLLTSQIDFSCEAQFAPLTIEIFAEN
jgi:hypothetical protein